MMTVLVALTAGGVAVGSAVVARHRAQAAADLAALAGASHAPFGDERACAHAGAVVRRMDATLTTCAVDGLDVVVGVSVGTAFTGLGSAHAVARAGPVEGPPGVGGAPGDG